ncbi:MAG TPA: LysM domain-containing protein [Kofleriaceae bacterium]|nr:LysM domain-containing protein [Kofleriaceae bacterium]
MIRRLSRLAACAGVLLAAGSAAAQMPTVSPRGEQPPPAPAPPPPPPVVVNVPAPGTPAEPPPQTNWYMGEPTIEPEHEGWNTGTHGPIPEHHVVRQGDTLWDIAWIYYNDPWDWPRLWSYNPTITNPHWIYPGDLIRLYPKGEGPVVVYDDEPDRPIDNGGGGGHPITVPGGVTLRQLAYVDRDRLKYAARIEGSVEEKELLSVGDQVYLSYPPDHPPTVGGRYAVYAEKKAVNHPDKKKGKVGSYVLILGEVTVVSVKKGKLARAVIEEANDIIQRGALVGPIQRQYRGDAIAVVPPTRDLQGTIVAMLRHDQLIGEGELVFIDLGRDQKIVRGNPLHIIRRGDARPGMASRGNIGEDDRKYPSRSIGQCVVVDVGKSASSCLVIASDQEFEIGDLVLMQAEKK